MKFQRSFCFLLALCFIFLEVFSLSIFAYDVNGHSITTSYKHDSSDGWHNYETTIVSNETSDYIDIQINIPLNTAIADGSVLDYEVSFDLSSCESVEPVRWVFYGANGEDLGHISDFEIKDKKAILTDYIITGADLVEMDVVIRINGPSWQENIIEEPEDESILGTWVFNSNFDISTLPSGTYYIDFTYVSSSSGNTLTKSYLKRSISGNYYQLLAPTSGGSGNIEFAYTSVPNKVHSCSAKDKTFTITGGSDITNEIFITWLRANATKIDDTSASQAQYVGTWVLNPTISYNGSSTVNFDDIKGKFYGKSSSSSSSLKEYDIMRITLTPTDNIFTVKNMYNLSSGYCYTAYTGSSWKSVYYSSSTSSTTFTSSANSIRTLVITEEPTNQAFIDWLTSNATKVDTANYALARSTVEYTYNFTVTNVSQSIKEGDKLLGGILGWIKNVWNSITNLPKNIANAIKGFFDNVVDGLSALGQFIIDGIKGLFVPSEEAMIDIKGRFEQLLSDRFGAVYDSTQIISDFANAFNSQSQSAMIDGTGANGFVSFPSVTVNLANVPFTFGGWEVDLIPDKFQTIIDILKLITNVVCTFVFVNAMRRRLEGVLK